MVTGINSQIIFSVMITDQETNFTPVVFADNFGNLSKNNVGNILVCNHAVIFTGTNPPNVFSGGNVCVLSAPKSRIAVR